MTEIWVPYGPVEVSFDIKQENLSQILEPQPSRLSQEDVEKRLDSVTAEAILLLSGSLGTQKALDTLLTRNKGVTKLYHPKSLGTLARRKAQEFGIAAEPLNLESMSDVGIVDSSPARLPTQVKEGTKLALMTSVHYDPMFGLTSAASDLVSLIPELKAEAFKRSLDELPCQASSSNASWYSIRALQTCPNVDTIEVIEKSGILNLFYGDIESVHSQAVDYWTKSLAINLPSKAERVIFGCGGLDRDKTLHDALARSFFNIVTNVALRDAGARVCMLAECSQGLGSEALLRYATGRYVPGAKLDAVSYFDGLEVLLSFYRVQRDLELHILTTLPIFYASRFDFKTLRGARDAPSALVSQGSRAKILVVPDASSSSFLLSG